MSSFIVTALVIYIASILLLFVMDYYLRRYKILVINDLKHWVILTPGINTIILVTWGIILSSIVIEVIRVAMHIRKSKKYVESIFPIVSAFEPIGLGINIKNEIELTSPVSAGQLHTLVNYLNGLQVQDPLAFNILAGVYVNEFYKSTREVRDCWVPGFEDLIDDLTEPFLKNDYSKLVPEYAARQRRLKKYLENFHGRSISQNEETRFMSDLLSRQNSKV